jgi:hypothetical protein
MRLSLSLVVVLTICSTPLGAQPLPVARLKGDHFVENLRSEAPVSGGDVVGIVVGDHGAPNDARKLYVRRPAVEQSQICIEAATIDGSYVASNTYLMPAAAPGMYVQIPIDTSRPLGTSHPDLFRSATVQTVAIMARTGACAEQRSDLIPIAWGEPPAPGANLKVILAVQSGRTSSFILIGEGSGDARSCDPILQGRRTAFDALCSLELPSGKSGALRLRLRRCAFDDCTNAPPVDLEL